MKKLVYSLIAVATLLLCGGLALIMPQSFSAPSEDGIIQNEDKTLVAANPYFKLHVVITTDTTLQDSYDYYYEDSSGTGYGYFPEFSTFCPDEFKLKLSTSYNVEPKTYTPTVMNYYNIEFSSYDYDMYVGTYDSSSPVKS